jgi:hypothetical protein
MAGGNSSSEDLLTRRTAESKLPAVGDTKSVHAEKEHAMATEDQVAALEREQAVMRGKLRRLEKTLDAQRQEVEARKFVLVDENGSPRARLSVDKDGPRLSLLDENGKSRARLAVGKDGPRLSLRDANGKTRARLSVAEFSSGQPGLCLFDENGKERVMLDMTKDGLGLRLADGNGNTRAELALYKDRASMVLYDENEKVIWSTP